MSAHASLLKATHNSPDSQTSSTPSSLKMELELGLAPPNTNFIQRFDLNDDDIARYDKKRGFDRAFVHKNGDDDDNNGCNINLENPYSLNKLQSALVGWPPIKDGMRRNKRVKVKMEGMAIGRKIDLSLLDSYQALIHILRQMFPEKLYGINSTQQNCKVTYEDEEGDWMLVGDVPWETFIGSVKRLKVLGDQSLRS